MSIFRAKTGLLGRRQCKRCRRMFHPRKEGQEYGPTCARKVAGNPETLERYGQTVDPLLREKRARQSAEESAVAAYRGAVLA